MESRTLSGWVTRTGLVGTDAGGRLVSARTSLRVTRGPDAGTTVELDSGSAVVGTHRSCELRLSDPTVSRRHTELLLLSGAVRVRDLGSKNGTFVGGAKIDDATVPLPFELKVGATHVEVRPAEVVVSDPISERASFGALVGESAAMRRVFGVLERVAATDAPILFSGEPGTGKTIACATVHQHSGREGPLLFLDPSRELSPEVIDAALVAAHGGSLILERVDAWPRRASEALIAAIDARHRAGTRVFATAGPGVRAAVEEGRIPRALWFYVGAVHLVLPPLRERREDVPLLIAAIARELGSAPPELTIASDLPGNVRELHGLVVQAIARRAPAQLAPIAATPSGYHEAKEQLLEDFERRYLVDLMARHDGVVLRAAEEAGLGRNHLARLLKKHGLK